MLRELGLSSSYVDGSGYRVLALLIDPPGTTIGPERGWGLPHTFAKICILIQKAKKNRLGDPKPFFLEAYSLTFRRPEFPVPTDRVKECSFWGVCGFLIFFCLMCVFVDFL